MTEADQDRWHDAVLTLFGGMAFAMTGAREHADWRRDAANVMRLKAVDPRGWTSINGAPDGDVWTTCGPSVPFLPPSLDDFDSVFEVSRESAAQLLVTLQGEWFQTAGIPEFEAKKDELLAQAGVILGRFGAAATCYTNASAAKGNQHANMFLREAMYESFTDYTMDCGLIVVSDSEVGVFWSFIID